jgi:hypothetical protein
MSARRSSVVAPEAVQLWRRHLVLGTLCGVPLALSGCGGGGSDEPLAEDDGVLPDGRADGVPVGKVAARVQWPSGFTPPAGELRLKTALGEAVLVADAASVDAFIGGPQLTSVRAADGKVLLWGWVGEGEPPISADTTAAVLLHQLLQMAAMPAGASTALRAQLPAWAPTQTLAARVADALRADAAAVDTLAPAITQAIDAAVQALIASTGGAARRAAAATAGRARAAGVIASPQGMNSGIELVQADALDTIYFQNDFCRRAVVFINRVGYATDAGGTTVNRKEGTVIEVPLPKAFDSFANTISAGIEEYYGGVVPGVQTQGSLFRSVTEQQALEAPPEGYDRAVFKAVALMVSDRPGPDANLLDELSASQREYIEGVNLRNLKLRFILEDFLAPFVFDAIGAALKIPESSKWWVTSLQELASGLFDVLRGEMPTELERVLSYQMSVGDFASALFGRLRLTSFAGKVFSEAFKHAAKLALAAPSGGPNEALRFAFAQGADDFMRNVPVLQYLDYTDKILKVLHAGRLNLDVDRSVGWLGYDIETTRTRVTLTPESGEVAPQGRLTLTATVVGASDPNAVFTYIFTAQGGPGRLIGAVSEGKTVTQSEATIDYLADTSSTDSPPETVQVEVWQGGLNNPNRTKIGTARCTVKLTKPYSLQVTPANGKLRPNGAIGMIAGMRQALPDDAVVNYSWSASRGSINDSDQATTPPRLSSARFTAPDSEGTARVTVTATVAWSSNGGGLVRCDPVDVDFEITRAAKTIEFRCFTDSIAETFANADGTPYCNVTHVTWVPEVAGAASYATRQTGCTDPYGCSYLSRSWTPQSHYDIGKRGGMWYFGMGGDSGGCADVSQRVSVGKARYASAVVTCTVTLAD